MNTDILNMRELFGDVYKITYDPAAGPKSPLRKDPEYLVIPAKYGYFYPVDDSLVAFFCTSKRVAKRVLEDLGGQVQPYVGVTEDGDIGGEFLFLFEVVTFETVAKIAGAYNKRKAFEKKA